MAIKKYVFVHTFMCTGGVGVGGVSSATLSSVHNADRQMGESGCWCSAFDSSQWNKTMTHAALMRPSFHHSGGKGIGKGHSHPSMHVTMSTQTETWTQRHRHTKRDTPFPHCTHTHTHMYTPSSPTNTPDTPHVSAYMHMHTHTHFLKLSEYFLTL